MPRRLVGLGLLLVLEGCRPQAEPPPLNVVFFLVDDLGWADLGVSGSRFYETPNIDRLAGDGMRFTNAYAAAPVCSPTRASILSGKYPARMDTTDWFGADRAGRLLPAAYVPQLPLEEVTLAEAFKQAGYATAFVGKWHLGDRPYFPENQGFDLQRRRRQVGRAPDLLLPVRETRLTRLGTLPRPARWEGGRASDRPSHRRVAGVPGREPGRPVSPLPLVLRRSHAPDDEAGAAGEVRNQASSPASRRRTAFPAGGTP